MKTVSDAYKNSMKQPLRNPSHVQVTVDSVNRNMVRDGTWSTLNAAPWSDLSALGYPTSWTDPIATLELNYWDLDGSFVIMEDGGTEPGYVSIDMADENGDIQASLTWNCYSTTYLMPPWTLVFDNRAKEWPRVGYVVIYQRVENESGQAAGVTTMDSISVSRLTDPVMTQNRIPVPVNVVQIGANKVLPYHRFRVNSFLFGISLHFSGDDLINTHQEHDVDPLSRRLPQESLEFTVIDLKHRFDPENPAGMYEYIYTRSSVSIAFGYELPNGTTEWLAPDRYVLNARPVFDNGRVTFKASGLIASLTGTYYKDVVGTKDLKTMAENVLQDAADQGYIPQNSWEVDDSLEGMETTGVLPISTHAECLQMIAHAARCVLYTDGENTIHIAPFTISQEITNDLRMDYTTVYENTQLLSRTDLLKAVSVSEYGYVDGAQEAETLYSATTTDTTLHVEFPLARDVAVTVTGASVVRQNVYARAVDLKLSTGTKDIVITGIPQSKTETIATVDVNAEGETDREANELITSDAMRDALSAHVRAYLSLRNTYDVTYRGNPELETRDVVQMQTRYTGIIPVLVLTDSITFTGALRGSIKGKGLI